MQKQPNENHKMALSSEEDIFNFVVRKDNPFRKLEGILDFKTIVKPLRKLYSDIGHSGIDIEKGIKALLIQFWEDYSDREMESALYENMAVRWFCGFGIMEYTPDHSYFGKLRKRIGTSELSKIFNAINAILEEKGLFGNVFTFIDASSIITKTALWEERDKAIKDGEEKFNNINVHKYATDTDARWGAKGKNNVWFGYKRHIAADMRHGLIKKVMVTPGNTPDFKAVEHICPDNAGMVFADKGYDYKKSDMWIRAKGASPATIRKRNNKEKNKNLDKWRTKIRSPFEGVFSKTRKRAKYRGHTKVLFQVFAECIVHNLKKAVTILPLEINSV
jgi:IS5 family transposase